MAGTPIKFRCYRCNQLLGAARSKAGGVVACPKCAAELEVPEPSESAPASSGPLDSGLALDFLDIRPEDIRVEPGLNVLTTEPEPPADEPPAPEPSAAEDAPPATRVVEPAPRDVDAVLPSIRLDAPTLKPPSHALPPRPRDLILPRSVVTAWSLFVLLALAFAFLSGLLAGHYVWRVH